MAQNKVQVSDDQFRRDLKTQYRILEMPGDGNCLFSALALAAFGSMTYQMRSRKEVKKYIKDNWNLMEGLADFTDPEVLQEYEKMDDDFFWSGDVALSGACFCYNFAIVLEQPGLPITTFEPLNPVGIPTTVYLSYHNKNHYNLLIPKDPPPTSPIPQSEVPSNQDSDADDVDSDECFSSDGEESSVLAAEGFAFAAYGFFKKARDDVCIAVLVPGANLKHRNLFEALLREKPKFVRFVTLYDKGDVLQLLGDDEVKCVHTLYMQNFKLPLKLKYHDRAVWLSEALTIPLLLSQLCFKWRNVEISVLCKKSSKSLAMKLLNRAWRQIGNSVMDEMNYIMANNETFFCVKCKPTCPHFGKPWHTDPTKYLLQEISEGKEGFFEVTNEHPNTDFMAPIWKTLATIQVSNASQNYKLKQLKSELDKNARLQINDWFSTYLVIHMDGIGIENYAPTEVYEILLDDNIKRSVYAGMATNQRFRTEHFRGRQSSIFKVLTKTSRLFYIRSKTFASEEEARIDEGILIETLKCYLNWQWQKDKVKPFLLLNKRSESRKLIGTGAAEMVKLNEFIRSGIPIIRPYPLFTTTFNWSRFPGNFEISEIIPMLNGPYKDRNFNDNAIQLHYLWLEGQILS